MNTEPNITQLDIQVTDLRTRAERRRQRKIDHRADVAEDAKRPPRAKSFSDRYEQRAAGFTFRQLKNVLTRFPKRLRGLEIKLRNTRIPEEKKMHFVVLGQKMAIAVQACMVVLKARNYGASPARPMSEEAWGRWGRRSCNAAAFHKSVMDEIGKLNMIAEGGQP